MFANNYISTIVENQLPEFIRADHPTFVTLLKKYYEYMEQTNKTLRVGKDLYDYMDVDTTRADLIKYFKTKIIPNFPEETELSTEKLVKAAKFFYSKKGSAESFKFLFRTLYGQEADVYFPKQDVLRASDGKWNQPQALRLAFFDTLNLVETGNVNVAISGTNTIAVSSNGINFIDSGITANSYIQIGSEKRKVVNVSATSLNVEIAFLGTGSITSNLISITNGGGVHDNAANIIVTFSPPVYANATLIPDGVTATGNVLPSMLVSGSVTGINIIDPGSKYRTPPAITISEPDRAANATAVVAFKYNTAKLYKVTLSEYSNFNIKLLEKCLGTGEDSRTTCVIEKAVVTVDGETGREFVELYVSNVRRLFDAGENLVVQYKDENGEFKTFKSKIISLISNIYLYRNRLGVVQTGRKYKTGDPVVLHKGLSDSPEAVKAIAVVNNVSTGSIESVDVIKPGRFFRADPNSLIRVLSTSGIGANVIISTIWDDTPSGNAANIDFCTDAIVYKNDILLNAREYDFDNVTTYANQITNAGNTTTTINLNTATHIASTVNDYYKSFVVQIIDGTGASGSPNSAVISGYDGTTKIATLATALATAPGATSNLKIYANAQTEIGRALTYDAITLGKIRALELVDGGSFFEEPPTFEAISLHESDYSFDQGLITIPTGQFSNYNRLSDPPSIKLNASNTSYSLANGFYTGCRLFLDVGDTAHYAKIIDYIVEYPSTPALTTKTLYLDREFESNINQINILRFKLYLDLRPNVRGSGKLGEVIIRNGGTGYNPTYEILEFVGTGYGANAYYTINGSGAITSITLDNRGEGYPARPTVLIRNNVTGAIKTDGGAILDAILLSDDEELAAETTDIGRIQDFRIINRGFDYANTPITSLKIVDILTDNLAPNKVLLSGDSMWQGGATNLNATFIGTIDDMYRPDATNTVIRVFNYSGSINTAQTFSVATSSGNLTLNLFAANATVSFKEINDPDERAYPFFYGDGRAKANAEFLNGLIKYSGFYLNTDGFLSADKKLQDGEYYHNFSYEISSEKSLDDYKESVYKAAHPAGMQLLSKFVFKDILPDPAILTANVYTSNTLQATNANTSYSSNVLYGNNANFTSTAGVGDLIVINTTETAYSKQYTRVITNVVDDNVIWMESPIGGLGDGKIRTVSASLDVTVFGNTSPVSDSLEAGDNISFNVDGTIYNRYVTSTPTTNVVTLNATVGASGNVLYIKTPSYNVVSYKIIRTQG